MKNILYLTILVTLCSSCKKNALKTYPRLVGTWYRAKWCVVESYGLTKLTIDQNGKGTYYSSFNDISETNYSGKVKTKGNELYVDGNFVMTIFELKDTVGYIYNPGSFTSLCNYDSIHVSAVLRGRLYKGSYAIFYKN